MRNIFTKAGWGGGEEQVQLPTLDLSGPLLAAALRDLISTTEADGGVERYVQALTLKSELFADTLKPNSAPIDRDTFMRLCTFMPTVRRKIPAYLDPGGFELISDAIAGLLRGAEDAGSADQRMQEFCGRFTDDSSPRWVRDLAAEILHNVLPEKYPLMCRWVWDTKANTGVLREIWHGDDVDGRTIPIDDDYATFATLRSELAQYLSNNGIFEHMLAYVDLLCAQVYAQYICAQGGSYLRADFSSPDDPAKHLRRMIGLDGVKPAALRRQFEASPNGAQSATDRPLLD
jgi:hypothetical protein